MCAACIRSVENTYGVAQLTRRLLDSLARAGHPLDRLTVADFISFDELHVMGRTATVALGTLAGLSADLHVLDIGCGVGGPARTLVDHFGCRVAGIDLSRDYAIAAGELSRRVGLADRLSFQCADARCLPFADHTFDVAVLIHVAMNIADKKAMLNELGRVLIDGGRLALWEICQGPRPDLIFPVPWSDDASFSHLLAQEELLDLIRQSRFELIHAEDATREAWSWVQARMQPKGAKGPRPQGLDLDLLMPDFRRKRRNIALNLERGSISLLRAVAVKTGQTR